MHHRFVQRLCVVVTAAAVAAPVLTTVSGCTKQPEKKVTRYQPLPEKEVAGFMRGSVMEFADIQNLEAFPVSSYGLVANLNGTGNSTAPSAVRQYMTKEMQKHRFGSESIRGLANVTPAMVLRDPRFAIVRVDGYLPPGIRKGQHFDVNVSALSESSTTSLARGTLYQSDLRIDGANPITPGGSINVFARAQGPIFVNPVYAFERNPTDPEARRSLRQGVVMDGGVSSTDRPVMLRVRKPQFSVTRRIELAIDERMQDVADMPKKGANSATFGVAEAQDEAFVYCYVPRSFDQDWEHFTGVVSHIYLENSPDFVSKKSREIAEAAVRPGVNLNDVSFAWEALGANALPAMVPLMTHENPEIAYAATRAAAFLGEASAPHALSQMANTAGHPYRIKAVQTLGAMRNSQLINELLRPLLDSEESMVRIAAYEALARHHDATVFTTVVGPSMTIVDRADNGSTKERVIKDEKFVLDIVKSTADPIVYCSQRGIPRVAIIGDRTQITTPLVFTAMDSRLSISSNEDNRAVTIFYRPPPPPGGMDSVNYQASAERLQPVKVQSRPDLAELIARLAGEGEDLRYGAAKLNFNYGEVVSILTAMSEGNHLSAVTRGGSRVPTALVLQETGNFQDTIFSAPAIPGTETRPQSDAVDSQVGLAK